MAEIGWFHANLGSAYFATGQYSAAERAYQRALETSHTARDRTIAVNARYHRSLMHTRQGAVERVQAAARTALQLAEDAKQPALYWSACATAAQAEILTGQRTVISTLHEMVDDARRTQGSAFAAHMLTPWIAAAALVDGAPEHARDLLIRYAAKWPNRHYLRAPLFLAHAHLALGDLESVVTTAEAARTHAATIGDLPSVAGYDHVLGHAALADGDLSRAERLFYEALVGLAGARLVPEWTSTLDALAAVAITQESWAEGVRLATAADAARHQLGLEFRFPYEQQVTERALLSARGSLGTDRDTIWTEAQTLSLDDATALARRARGQRRRPDTGWASLTPAEQQVVALVGKGLTNPQIANQLYISVATVKTHLVHVYAKLGLTTRTALAAATTKRNATT